MGITKDEILRISDRQAQLYARALGHSTSTYGIGTTGDTERAAGSFDSWVDDVDAIADTAVKARMLSAWTNAQVNMTAAKLSVQRALLTRLETEIRRLGETGVTNFLTYLERHNYGAGGTNTVLLPPEWLDIYAAWKSVTLSRRHLYFEVLNGGTWRGTTYSNGLRKLVVGTGQTAGFSIASDYAGGVPYLDVTGLSGSGLVTVTGTELNPATGTVTAGKTWTVTASANGDVALASGGASAASANALILAVSDITAAGGISAGTLVVEAKKPTRTTVIAIP